MAKRKSNRIYRKNSKRRTYKKKRLSKKRSSKRRIYKKQMGGAMENGWVTDYNSREEYLKCRSQMLNALTKILEIKEWDPAAQNSFLGACKSEIFNGRDEDLVKCCGWLHGMKRNNKFGQYFN